jgi:hypothetical protein
MFLGSPPQMIFRSKKLCAKVQAFVLFCVSQPATWPDGVLVQRKNQENQCGRERSIAKARNLSLDDAIYSVQTLTMTSGLD